jgi:hypothetical protein
MVVQRSDHGLSLAGLLAGSRRKIAGILTVPLIKLLVLLQNREHP